jgi:outer membrane protein assembly factor BamB
MAQWPRFLGPGGNSFSPCTNPPVAWDVATGTNILWRSPVAAPGFGSPVIWSNQVFLSGGTAAARSVCCYHATNGALVWQRPVEGVPGSPTPVPSVPESTGFAAATVATDGRHVYAIFANGDLVAFALDGRRVWAKAFGALKNAYGHGASLVAGQGRLLVQLDHGDREAGLSRLYSLDALTGRVVWERSRPVPSSWATPLAVETPGRAQVVTLAEPFIIAYAAADGTELWRAECLSGEVTSSPIWAGGLVLAISPNEKLLALRADGQGDVTKSHVLWTVEDMMPDIASPASDGELAYTATSTGVIACYEVKTGKEQWKQELGQPVNASPALAGGHLYVFTRKGTAVVAEAGRQFKELARNEMGSAVFASPAWARDRLVVRTATELVCIATGAARGGRP